MSFFLIILKKIHKDRVYTESCLLGPDKFKANVNGIWYIYGIVMRLHKKLEEILNNHVCTTFITLHIKRVEK